MCLLSKVKQGRCGDCLIVADLESFLGIAITKTLKITVQGYVEVLSLPKHFNSCQHMLSPHMHDGMMAGWFFADILRTESYSLIVIF